MALVLLIGVCWTAPSSASGPSDVCETGLHAEIAPKRATTVDLVELRLCGRWPSGEGPLPDTASTTIDGSVVNVEVTAQSQGPAAVVAYDFTVPLLLETVGTYSVRVRIADASPSFSSEQTEELELEVVEASGGQRALRDCPRSLTDLPFFDDPTHTVELEPADVASHESVRLSVRGGWCHPFAPRLRSLTIDRDLVRVVLEAEPETFDGAGVTPFDVEVDFGPLDFGLHQVVIQLADRQDPETTALLDVVPLEVGILPLRGCAPDPWTLCLDSSREARRFSVTVEITPPGETPRRAYARRLSSETGAFTLFALTNFEVVVKLLDACQAPYERFWFFGAGLTDLPVTVAIVDTRTGSARTYQSQGGASFDEIADTDAFDCP